MVKLYQEYKQELWAAFEASDVDAIDKLFAERPTLKGLSTSWTTLLHDVVTHSCSLAVIDHLIKLGFDVNAKTKGEGMNVLSCAAYTGRADIISLLLKRGAMVDVSESHLNPLIAAIGQGNIESVKLFIDEGVDLNIKYNGNDALWFAAGNRDQQSVDLIISHLAKNNPALERKLRKRANRLMSYKEGFIMKRVSKFFELISIYLGRI